MKSYNQILAVFEEIGNAHQQIRTFGSGDPAFITEGIQYPLMWVVPDTLSLGIDNEGGNFTKDTFKIIFADLLHDDGSNQNEVLSDQKAIAMDVLSQLQLSDYSDIFTIESTGRGEPIFEDIGPSPTADRIAGWMVTITLRVDYLSNHCQVPSTLNPSDSVGCPDVTIVSGSGLQIDTAPAGSTYTIPDVQIRDYKGDLMAAQDYALIMNSTQLERIYAYPPPTGQTTEYRTRDDRWVQVNLFNSVPSVGYIIPIDPDDRTKLLGNNTFGNTSRFTDTIGGQTYANNYIIDHGTGLGWFRTLVSSLASWNAYVDYGLTMNEAGFSDYFLPSINHYLSVMQVADPDTAIFNWRFNDDSIVTSTTLQPLSTHFYRITISTQRWAQTSQSKAGVTGSIFYAMYCRKHF